MPRPLVMVVEDDFDVRDALREILEEEGYAVATAADGREALQVLRAEPTVAVILLDLMMPVMNGWQFRAEQQRDEALARIPVLVLTADNGTAAPLIAEGYLKKPIRIGVLLDAVKAVLVPT